MDNLLLLGKALLAGFVVAAPMGPIGAICMRRALGGQWLAGLVTGIGSALADAIMAAGAAFGLVLIKDWLQRYQVPLEGIGGLALLYFGIHMYRTHPQHLPKRPPGPPKSPLAFDRDDIIDLFKSLVSGFGFTMINPTPFVAFAAIFAGLGILTQHEVGYHSPSAIFSSLTLIVGVLLGSTLWWSSLAAGSAAARDWLSYQVIDWINKALGTVVAVVGIVAMADSLWIFLNG